MFDSGGRDGHRDEQVLRGRQAQQQDVQSTAIDRSNLSGLEKILHQTVESNARMLQQAKREGEPLGVLQAAFVTQWPLKQPNTESVGADVRAAMLSQHLLMVLDGEGLRCIVEVASRLLRPPH